MAWNGRPDRAVAWPRAGGILCVAAMLVIAACTGEADEAAGGNGAAGAEVTEAGADERDDWGAYTLEWICEMLTLEEVTSALEQPAEVGTAHYDAGGSTCVWQAGSSAWSVRLQVHDRAFAISDDAAPVEGLGAEAGWRARTRTLEVLDGDIRLTLSLHRADHDDDAPSLEIAVELARKVLERIPSG